MPIGIMGNKSCLTFKAIQQQRRRKNEYMCLCCFLPPRWNTVRFAQATIKTTITHNNFRHCRVNFTPFVRNLSENSCSIIFNLIHVLSVGNGINKRTASCLRSLPHTIETKITRNYKGVKCFGVISGVSRCNTPPHPTPNAWLLLCEDGQSCSWLIDLLNRITSENRKFTPGCLPFTLKNRLVDSCSKWHVSNPEWKFLPGLFLGR